MTIFGLKVMVKSGLEKNICPVQKNLPRRAELAWLRGHVEFQKQISRPLLNIILSQKWSFQDLRC
jgi:5-methylcytosine-specific restriction endonuclease McrBC regulatory subunit McrC